MIDEVYEYYKLKKQIRNINSFKRSNGTGMIKDDIMVYMKIVSDVIKSFYPKTTCTISIKLISQRNLENPINSKVVTWAAYPYNEFNNKLTYTIKIIRNYHQ